MKNVYCPVTHSYHSTGEVLEEIKPLVEFLDANTETGETLTFARGTVTGDGRLDLCKQSIGIEGCQMISEALKNNKVIKAVLFGTDGIGNEGAKQVAGLIDHNETLETVYLGCNNIGSEGTQFLAKSLEDNRSVKGLWLKRNPLGAAGAKRIAEMLGRNTTLKILDLVSTAIDEEGLDAVLDVLIESNRTLEKLYLSGNQITSKQAARIAELLRRNEKIDTLMLSVNFLGDDGAVVISEALGENKSLQNLGLASNGILLRGGKSLLEALKNNRTLKYLDLGYAISTKVLAAERNAFGDELAAPCREFLEINRSLQSLELVNTGITGKGLKIIEEGLFKNPNLIKLTINGKLSEEAKAHLRSNEQESKIYPDAGIQAIRSVYRVAK